MKRNLSFHIALLLITGSLITIPILTGCNSTPEKKENKFLTEWRARVDESRPHSPGRKDRVSQTIENLESTKKSRSTSTRRGKGPPDAQNHDENE